MQSKYLQNRKGSQGVPCSPQKKGSSLMVPFFVESKGGKCVAFSFPTPIQTFPWGKALSLRAEAPRGRVVREGFFCSGGGGFWGTFWVRCYGRPLAGASRLGPCMVPLSVWPQRRRFALFGAVVEVCFCRWPLYSVCGLDCVSVPLPQRQ